MAAKDDLGRAGEQIAARYLTREGYVLLSRNWRCQHGELDIVALDHDEIVVVEVKTRTSERFGHPFEAIDRRKLARVWRLAMWWCATNHDAAHGAPIRVDAIGLTGRGDGTFRLEHLRDLR